MTPQPVPVGTILAERFEVLEVLGQGVFTITYQAKDKVRGDNCVVKELAPEGSVREDENVLNLKPLGVAPQHLRQRFHDEIRRVGRLHLPSILPVRSTFSELGTAYYVIDYVPGTITLLRHVQSEGRLGADDLHKLIQPIFETLEGMHDRGVVHKDITPENILVTPRGRLLLVSPGGAKEWLADAREAQDLFFATPYAPPEGTTDRLDRGPATDVYGICATLYFALSSTPPPAAMERLNGAPLVAIETMLSEADLVRAVEAGMSLQFLERPQTIAELRRMFEPDDGVEDAGERLERLDELIYKMRKFGFERRECPSCKGVLETPKPLAKGRCPVCHDGYVKLRDLPELACAACGSGVLKKTKNEGPLAACPICRVGDLKTGRKKLLSKEIVSTCEKCEAYFEVEGDSATFVPPEGSDQERQTKTWEEWRLHSKRPKEFYACDACEAQYDQLSDGRWQQMAPTPTKWKVLYPEEWAKVVAGLSPLAGNAECAYCKADYQLDRDRLTLLAAYRDPFGYAERHRGRLLKEEDVRWKGSGKESPNPGLVCSECQTELDFDDDKLRLIRSSHPVLRRMIGHSRSLEDWHRLGEGLPLRGHEHDFDQEFDQAIAHGYEVGTLSFEERNEQVIVWRSPATRLQEKNDKLSEGRSGTLLITPKEILFGNRLRKWKMPLSTVVDVSAEDNVLTLIIEDERTPILFELNPIEFTIKLEHTKRTITVNALNLALRLAHEIKSAKREVALAR